MLLKRPATLAVFSVFVATALAPAAYAGEAALTVPLASATNSAPANPPALAIDGNAATSWNSGTPGGQSITIDTGSVQQLTSVNLTTSQAASGTTNHNVYVSSDGANFSLVNQITGSTADNQALTSRLGLPARFVKIETTVAPSNVAWREIQVLGPSGGPAPYEASVVGWAIPGTMKAGNTYLVSVGVRNLGSDTWSAGASYKLGTRDATTWSINRVAIPSFPSPNITNGNAVYFTFSVTAPSTPGTYSFDWQMLQEGVAWFGEPVHAAVVVTSSSAPTTGSTSIECALTPSGQTTCSSFRGASCSLSSYGAMGCTSSGAVVQCSRIDRSLYPICQITNGGTNLTCYVENNVEKCFPTDNHFSASTPSLTWGTTSVNSQSNTLNVTFSADSFAGAFTANGLILTGDFVIVGSSGVCAGAGTSNSTCLVQVAAKPQSFGTRSGFLSWDTNRGVVSIPLSTTGGGLANLGNSDMNSGIGATQRPITADAKILIASSKALRRTTKFLRKDVNMCTAPGTGGGDPEPSVGSTDDSGTYDGSFQDDGSTNFDYGSGSPPPGDETFPPGDEGGIGGHNSIWARFFPHDEHPHVIHKIATTGAATAPINLKPENSNFGGQLSNIGVGNQVQAQDDFAGQFPAPLYFSRVHNSQLFSALTLVRQNVGAGWRSSWDYSIWLNGNRDVATVARGTLGAYVFTLDVNTGLWVPQAGVTGSLVQNKDAFGLATGWTYTNTSGITELYDAMGRMTSLRKIEGPNYVLAYDTAGRLSQVQNNFGRSIKFSYNASGQLATMIDPAGGITQYSYTSLGRLASIAYPDSRSKGYQYSSASWPFAITALVDGNNIPNTTFTYDAQGRIASSALAGSVGSNSYSYVGTTTTQTDALGTTWTKSFSSANGESQAQTESVSCAVGCPSQSSQFTYTGFGALNTQTDRAGVQTRWDYNSRSLPVYITEAVGRPEARITTLTYHPTLDRIASSNLGGARTTTYAFDASGRMTKKTLSSGSLSRAVSYSYNGFGQVTQVDDARTDVSDVTSNLYDSSGNLLSSTAPTAKVTSYSNYNGLGQPGTITYPDGTARTRTYDAVGRMLTDVYLGVTTTSTYDPNGNPLTVSRNDGNSLTYRYDSAQRVTGVDNQLGEKKRYTLDGAGNVTQTNVYDAANNLVATSSAVYDGMGRLRQAVNAAGKITEFHYDNAGNLVWQRDPLQNVLQTTYDALGRPKQISGPLAFSAQTTYDILGQVTAVTDPNANTTTYGYTGLGDRSTVTSPDRGVTTSTFDTAGNVTNSQDARGIATVSQYDALGRWTSSTFGGTDGTSFVYDVGTGASGKVYQISDPSGVTTYSYDADGLLRRKDQAIGTVVHTTQYTRDAFGRITSMTYPSGHVLTIAYSQGRISALSWDGATVLTAVQYFPFGAPESWLFGDTTEYTRYTDTNGRIWKHLMPGGYRTLTYDDGGRITQIADSAFGTQSFGYDANGRLTSFGGFTQWPATESRSYSYDANGNRLSATTPAGTFAYSYVSGTNRLSSVSGPGGSLARTYDAAGNTLSDGQRTYTYNVRGRLLTAQSGSNPAIQFNYNALGQRVALWNYATNSGTVWAFDEAGHPIGEYAYPSGTAVQELVWLGSVPVAVAGSIPYSCASPPCSNYSVGFIWTDQNDTPRAITNTSGVKVWQWETAPFGESSANSNPSGLGAFSFSHRFPGQYLDVSVALHQNGARTYDPSIGRYVQSDPIGLLGGTNTYVYAEGNPLRNADPSGLLLSGLYAFGRGTSLEDATQMGAPGTAAGIVAIGTYAVGAPTLIGGYYASSGVNALLFGRQLTAAEQFAMEMARGIARGFDESTTPGMPQRLPDPPPAITKPAPGASSSPPPNPFSSNNLSCGP